MNTKQQPTQLIEVDRPNLPALTPMSMLEKALTSGASIDVMEKLMGLQERWEANQARKAFDNAMADAKAEIPIILKNQQVGYDTKGGGKTGYRHEDMAQIARTIDPIIAKHGLSYRFRTSSEAARVTVICIVSHREGHSEENSLSAGHDGSGGKNAIQGLGSALTYLQRYSVKAAFGLAASADDDGQMAGELSQKAAERARVPSPSEATAERKASSEPPQAPHWIKGGKDADSWAKLYLDAVLTSDSPDTVYKWIDLNKMPLQKISAEHHKTIDAAVQKHLASLRKIEPAKKNDPISSGLPPKHVDPEAVLAEIDRELDAVEAADDLQAVWDTACEPLMAKLDFPPDQDAAQGLFQKHEKRLGAG